MLFDAIYDPWPTPLAAAASANGVPVVSGLDLLLAQALGQFEHFSGRDPGPRRGDARGSDGRGQHPLTATPNPVLPTPNLEAPPHPIAGVRSHPILERGQARPPWSAGGGPAGWIGVTGAPVSVALVPD